MRVAAGVLLGIWLVFLLGWIGGMFYAGEIILLPPSDMGPVEWSVFFVAMYGLPVAAGFLFFSSRWHKSKGRGPNA